MLPRRVQFTTRSPLTGHAHLSGSVADNILGGSDPFRRRQGLQAGGSPPATIGEQAL